MSDRSIVRLFVSTGDVSGDMHAAFLIKALSETLAGMGRTLEVRGLGGNRMQVAGATLIAHTGRLSSIGLAESLMQVIPALSLLIRSRRALKKWCPDAVVLIDYPGVNIPLASMLRKRLDVPIIYYIPPEEWYWTTKVKLKIDRTHKIAEATHRVLAVHPREATFYHENSCQVRFVGHPMQDVVAARRLPREHARAQLGLAADQRLVGLMPGSREQELQLVWPVIAACAARMIRSQPDLQFLVPLASGFLEKRLKTVVGNACKTFPELQGAVKIVTDSGDSGGASALVIGAVDLALTKSGTITLELALQDVPQVVVYQIGKLTEWIGRNFLRLSEKDIIDVYLALPNIITNQPIVPEFRLRELKPEAIAQVALELISPDSHGRARQLAGYNTLKQYLGGEGAVERAADAILELVIEGYSAQSSLNLTPDQNGIKTAVS